VGIGAYSYANLSLYDIAERSVGSSPGVVLLREHFRSDTRIIDFSNQQFYDGKLIIRTDLRERFRPSFLDQCGGVFWIDTQGEDIRRVDSSWTNLSEVACIQTLLPRLVENLNQHDLGKLSLGIVTPFRAQEKILDKWLEDSGLSGKCTVGTAHKFQGDEKDVMIFSTVLAQDMGEGTLHWLEKNWNLLNVAVTRARVSLVVVGDWEFCRSLKEGHCFRRLADYVSREQGRVVESVDELPFFGKTPVSVIGQLTERHNREHNRTTLRRFIASCPEYVWWVDPYFSSNVFTLLWDIFQDRTVTIREVRLLTSSEQVAVGPEGQRPQIDLARYQQIRGDLAGRGIVLEMRLLSKRDLPHDRLLYAPGLAINMPPFGGAYGDHRLVSEYTRSGTDSTLFREYWDRADKTP